jgi:hypothetical protein
MALIRPIWRYEARIHMVLRKYKFGDMDLTEIPEDLII